MRIPCKCSRCINHSPTCRTNCADWTIYRQRIDEQNRMIRAAKQADFLGFPPSMLGRLVQR